VLLLDEPTNHLDLDSKEILEAALINYPGTLLFVSHDRYFLNRLTTRTVELADGKTTSYLGDYDYYLEKKEEQRQFEQLKEQKNETQVSEEIPVSKQSYSQDKEAKKQERQRVRRIEAIEVEMAELEEAIQQYETDLCDPDVYADHVRAAELQTSINSANETLETLMEEWEALQIEE
jgi:ATP-binding cassette, subfamily F, member 3